jgi:hypothetical protein
MAQITLLGSELTTWTSDQRYVLGTRYTGATDGKEYIYVKLANVTATVAVTATSVLAWLAATGRSTFTVVSDNSDADTKPIGAGVSGGTAAGTLATNYYGWIQQTGPFTATNVPTSAADGDGVYLSTTDDTLTVGAAADDPICAYANDASAKLCVAAFH